MATQGQFEVIDREADLLKHVDAMSGLADQERNSLGFWPPAALIEAIRRRAVIALVERAQSEEHLVGYIHHSGAFPHAKIQQIAINQRYRKQGNATALLNTLVGSLERQGYLSLRADIAANLQESLGFYRANGFVEVFAKPGGKSRKRTVLVHQRVLDTDDLFSLSNRSRSIDLGIHRRAAGDNPIYAFDLNVYFDLVRDRSQSASARQIFGAALAHDLRLAVAEEFSNELIRTSSDRLDDPILQMALRLPKLPKVEPRKHAQVAEYVHDLVFVKTGNKAAGTPQALSDAKHVAHAALARASGFITRDGSLLNARVGLLDAIGIDIISTEEIIDILPDGLLSETPHPVGQGFSIRNISQEEFIRFLTAAGVDESHFDDFRSQFWDSNRTFAEAVEVDHMIVAAASATCRGGTQRFAKCLVFVEPSNPKASLFCDHLIDRLITEVCAGKPAALQLAKIPGQSIVAAVARSKGFTQAKTGEFFEKFALGHPLSPLNWDTSVDELRRCTGLILPRTVEEWSRSQLVRVSYPSGETSEISLSELEVLLGPTLLVTPCRNGVLVPIAKAYADELLGTSNQTQFSFVANRDAAFASMRGYVNSPMRAGLFQPDIPIFFYESKRTGGRGGIVAVAKVTDSLVVNKCEIDNAMRKKVVVDNIDDFSAGDSVLITMFENLMRAPRVASLNQLRAMGAVDGANLVAAKSISADQMQNIVQIGWRH